MAQKRRSAKNKNSIYIAVAVLIIVILVAVILSLYFAGKLDPLLEKLTETSAPVETASDSGSGSGEIGSNVSAPKGVSPGTIDGVPVTIYFVNVGQGDAILLDLPDDKCMLIDGGTTKNPPQGSARDALNAKLSEVTKDNVIDYMIVTHSDTDHFSLLSGVLDSYEVKNIYFNDIEETSKVYTKTYGAFCKKAKEEEGANVVAVSTPDDNIYTFSVGACAFSVFSPGNDGFTSENARIKNGMSLITLLTYGERKILFTGDATDEEEEWFIEYTSSYDMDVDFLKIAHHGSRTSNTAAFLAYVQAEYGVISVGEGNSYGLPADETLQRIEAANVTYYRTDYVGTIVLTLDSDGDFLFEFPEKPAE